MAKLSNSAKSRKVASGDRPIERTITGMYFALNTDPESDNEVINCVSEHHAICAAIAANKKCGSYTRWCPCCMTKDGFHMLDIPPKSERDRLYQP